MVEPDSAVAEPVATEETVEEAPDQDSSGDDKPTEPAEPVEETPEAPAADDSEK